MNWRFIKVLWSEIPIGVLSLPLYILFYKMNIIADFEFDKAYFTSLPTIITVVLTYLSLLFSISRVMTEFKPIRLENLFIIHNSLLSAASLALLVAITPVIAKTIYTNGLDHAICAKEMAYNPYLNFLYYINYLMKFWELGDTLFLVFRKKNLEFLHVSPLILNRFTTTPVHFFLLGHNSWVTLLWYGSINLAMGSDHNQPWDSRIDVLLLCNGGCLSWN